MSSFWLALFIYFLLIYLTEGDDYEPLPLTDLTFTEVESRQCVNITILNDDPGIIEPVEAFEVTFLLTSGDVLIFDSSATVTIMDDDCESTNVIPKQSHSLVPMETLPFCFTS